MSQLRTLKFEHNSGANRGYTEFGGAQGRDRDFIGQKLAKCGQC